MASRIRREARLTFETLSIEGGLLSPEWLARVAQLGAGHQSEEDYRVPKGLSLRDEIGRYWRIAHAYWKEFVAGLEHHAPGPDDVDRRRVLSERFISSLLRDVLGFATLEAITPTVIDGHRYPISMAALNGRVPVVVTAAGEGVESASALFGDGGRRRSPFGLAQEYLNAAAGATWGIVADGHILRILRDNASLTRPAWIQADLSRMFSEQRYADFAALWLLAHESRFLTSDRGGEGPVAESLLDTWRSAGQNEGTRAREDLRDGFREALLALGQGFLSHPENVALRAALHSGVLTRTAYFQQLLRLVYRLIFLLTVEERDLLHPPAASDDIRRLYAAGYSLQRLRDRSLKRNAHDRFADLWAATIIVFRGLAGGEPRLGLPALAGLFAPNHCPDLDRARLENRALLNAIYRLAWLKQAAGVVRVNWRDMGPEELGSIYESLLELQPQIAQEGGVFTFAQAGEAKGNARKTTGSYYTPDSLVQVLLDSALEPVIAETVARNPGKPMQALLSLSVVDPACGSGHFLLAAARRLAAHVARLQANSTPSAAEYRRALRQVIGRCIYGVDQNDMAIELCKVSLWMEAVEPGLPLTFLSSHIQQGNALLGTTPELMSSGIPDAAWGPIEGDDKKTASALKRRNKAEAAGQRALDFGGSAPSLAETHVVAQAVTALDAAGDDNAPALAEKESQWTGILDSAEYQHQKLVADAWCAAFVWPKEPGDLAETAPTNELWRQIRDSHGDGLTLTTKTVRGLAEQYRFFHWHLQFPPIFAKGGFDVVLGNPPWERVKLQEQEFFASRSEEIASAVNAQLRKKLIAKLRDEDPRLWQEWQTADRRAAGESHLLLNSGRYPLCGRGDVNTYALFAEHNRAVLNNVGRAGFVAPTGLVTDDTTSQFFGDLMSTGGLVSLFDFENRKAIFPGVHRSYKFSLITLQSTARASERREAEFVFFAQTLADIADRTRRFTLTNDDVSLLNPDTRTCPVFRSQRDADITKDVYRNATVLGRRGRDESWGVDYLLKMVDPTIHREMLVGRSEALGDEELFPLYEGKLVFQFDHRHALFFEAQETRLATLGEKASAEFAIAPRYWLREQDFRSRSEGRPIKYRGFVSVRDVTNTTNERTVIVAIRPFVPSLNSLGSLFCRTPEDALILCACLNSFAADYVARQKVGGSHLSPFHLLQLAVIEPNAIREDAPWHRGTSVCEFIVPRALELTYTAWDLEPFARDAGHAGPPFRWIPDRRFLIRCELDAMFFHLYGLSHNDAAYVMDTFPIVRKNDEKVHGTFRTKETILRIFEAMAAAARSGNPYQTTLDPPPAALDPRIAHKSRTVEVTPTRATPATRPLPAWNPNVLPAAATAANVNLAPGAWATSLSGELLGMTALAAVLRNLSRPAPREDVEKAVVLTVLPRFMLANLGSAAAQWRSVIGASDLAESSVAKLGIPWSSVIRSAIQQNVLAEGSDGHWGPGAEVAAAPSPVFDARAIVALAWLATAPTESAEVTTQVGHLRAA